MGKRRGSGNLAAAIGLYKSGQDIEKLVAVRRLTQASRKTSFTVTPLLSPGMDTSPIYGKTAGTDIIAEFTESAGSSVSSVAPKRKEHKFDN